MKGWAIVYVYPDVDGHEEWTPVFLAWGDAVGPEIDVICSTNLEEHTLDDYPKEPGMWLWEGELIEYTPGGEVTWEGEWRRAESGHVLRLADGKPARGDA